MNKEEIFYKHSDVLMSGSGETHSCLLREGAFIAMDEYAQIYAKQQSIAFAKIVLSDVWGIHSSLSGSPFVSEDQLYDQFIEQQNKEQ